ncbi:MAG TPA: exodeoxyribonuclease V subunit alpha [Acidimicrobiales bacterium]|nr:exodeoxyribonuclease V subunit alpha [Acidimicrobiales bacterium]
MTVEPALDAVVPPAEEGDPFSPRLARRAPAALRDFNRAGVLTAADVHVALCLVRLGTANGNGLAGDAGTGDPANHESGAGSTAAATPTEAAAPTAAAGPTDASGAAGEGDADAVLLATALAVRAPRLGHVCTDLATIAGTVALDSELPVDAALLPWPEPRRWLEQLAASNLVAGGDGGDQHPDRPLRLAGTLLYLDRYWREEALVAGELLTRAEDAAEGVDGVVLREGLARLFRAPDVAERPTDLQRLAAAASVLRRFSVVAGGPGTGKTTTVARILALLHEQAAAAGMPPPLVALAAPTGKAAARLEEAVHQEAATLDVSDAIRDRLLAMEASTLHRLLGWRPGNRSRFRHHRWNRLPHEVVVVDETSMVSLSLMARLVEAVRPAARLVLVGDPEQLASVEAGAVLGDIVGPATGGLLVREPARRLLAEATGQAVPASGPPAGAGAGIGDGIVVLRHVHRFGGGIAALAEAVRTGDVEAAVALLAAPPDGLTWIDADLADSTRPAGGAAGAAIEPVRAAAVEAAQNVVTAARAGRGREAIAALGAFRILCAHRHGPYGVATWMQRVERWLAAGTDAFAGEGEWYPGRPLLVTENDYGLRLYNGDTGVVVADAAGSGRVSAVFERRGELLELSPTRLSAVDTVHAMTIHKSQGSQFDTVVVLLPDPTSPILTRELLYTAVTRARQGLILAGTEEAVRAAVGRPIARASGLRDRLWEHAGLSPAPISSARAGGDPRTVQGP